jgi:hypothetical protein
MAQRIYKPASVFDARVVGMRNLWEPSREYMGKPTEKPNYLVSIMVKKTRANWTEEPGLSNFISACSQLYNEALSHIPFQYVVWPLKDGDVTDPGKTNPEWRKGHWHLTGSSTSPINVSIVENGVPVPMLRRDGRVKNGDYCGVSASIAVKVNDPRGVKCYINNVMFTGPGEEIVIGNSVSATDLMEQAKAQGLNVTGFGASGVPQGGFGSAPTVAPVGVTGGQFGTPGPGNGFAFPSNSPVPPLAPSPVPPPGQQAGFGAPGGFIAPQGFPPRQ